MARSKKTQAAIEDALASHLPKGQVGLGVDIVNIERMRNILQRSPAFERRAFSEAERQYCNSTADPAAHFAARFAAKEAVVKALGCGFNHGVWIRDIEVVRQNGGRLAVRLYGRAAVIADEAGVTEIPISLSHSATDAIGCAIAITKSSLEASEKRIDAASELSRRFKDARGMLDDLPSSANASNNASNAEADAHL